MEKKGISGDKGDTGYVFTPFVDSEGNISWSNNGNLDNPTTQNIRGPQGPKGEQRRGFSNQKNISKL